MKITKKEIASKIINLSMEIRQISLDTRHNIMQKTNDPLSYQTIQLCKIWELAKELTDLGFKM